MVGLDRGQNLTFVVLCSNSSHFNIVPLDRPRTDGVIYLTVVQNFLMPSIELHPPSSRAIQAPAV